MLRRRLRVLMPSIVDPDVHRGGAWTSTRGVVELLRREPYNAEVVALVPREPSWRRASQAACLIAAHWGGMPAKARFVHPRAFRKELRRRLTDERFDVLLINGTDLLGCLNESRTRMHTLAFVHNREANLFADQVAATVPRPFRRLLAAESQRLRRFEIDGLRRIDAALFLSDVDAADYVRDVPGLDHIVMPPLFSAPPHRISKDATDTLDLGLLANFQWWPNRDAATWFIREVFDHLPADVRLHVFGREGNTLAPRHPRVVAHGFVDDLAEVWRQCDWMLNPTRYGSGVSVKTAESIYHGMPIVSSPFGLRGLPAFDHPDIVVCNEAPEWVSFLSSPRARSAGKQRLPQSVGAPFSLEANVARFGVFLQRMLEREPGAAAASAASD